MATGPNATEITGKNCNRYTFRVDLPNKVTVNTVYPSLKEHGKKWYFVAASYAWGIDAYNQMKDVLVKDGGTVLGFDQAPLGTTDFSSYILKLRQANPDVVYVGIGGADLTNFLKQLHEIGMTRKMPLSSPIINDSDLWAAGPEAAFGTFPKLWNYTGGHNTPRSQQFAKTYQQKNGQPPEVEAWQDCGMRGSAPDQTDVRLRSDEPKADQHQHAGQDGEQEAIGNAGRQVATD
jgi:branched-chain amino acid transport system substrate-binding protein